MSDTKKTTAIIRKKGSEWCVFSKDGKNLGCSSTKDGAKKRLQEVEFFKHKAKSDMSDNFKPDQYGTNNRDREKASKPLDIGNKTLPRIGTVAGRSSPRILDSREHFPIRTENQAKSAVKRVGQMTQVPPWFTGSMEDLQKMVYLGVAAEYPNLNVPVDLHLEAAMARLVTANSKDDATILQNSKRFKATKSDVNDALAILSGDAGVGDEKSGVVIDGIKIKNPEDNESKVPGVPRKKLQGSYEDRHAIARSLMDLIKDKKNALQSAEKVAKRLESKGLSGEEFKQLMLFIQEDILHELLRGGVKGESDSSAMRRVLENRRGE